VIDFVVTEGAAHVFSPDPGRRNGRRRRASVWLGGKPPYNCGHSAGSTGFLCEPAAVNRRTLLLAAPVRPAAKLVKAW